MLTRNTLGGLAVAAASIASAAFLAPAASAGVAMPTAATFPGYTHVDCPAGRLALASGSAVSDQKGMLLSGSTTTAGTGSFASAQSVAGSGEVAEVRSACVPATAVSGFTAPR
jgi:hypothetical protein